MDKKTSNILVVDDNPKNIQLVCQILKEASYNVGFATDGKQALNLLKQTNDYDLVLLDIDMPLMNGFEVCEIMRKDPLLNEMPVIFLTAFADTISIVKGFKIGAQDYVTKPFNIDELLARVKTHLELKQSKEKLKDINKWLQDEVTDKTKELKTSHDNLEKAYTELYTLDAMKTNFLNLISHEIRTPMNGIVGSLNIIKTLDHSSAFNDMVFLLDTSVSRLENFANNAILSTELSTQKYALNKSNTSLKELIQFVGIDMNAQLDLKNIKINTDNFSDEITINVDKGLLYKVFSYILSNAITHSPIDGEITVDAITEASRTTCSFSDQGAGFSKEVIKLIFKPFQSLENSMDKHVGISLYISKQIMDLHQGNINIRNIEPAGACVELIFNS